MCEFILMAQKNYTCAEAQFKFSCEQQFMCFSGMTL